VAHRLSRLVAGAAVAAPVLVGLAVAQTASAAPITCSVPGLIAAINAANGAASGATVTLAAGCVYTLATANNPTDGGTGLPVITGKVTVQGNGATIARSGTATAAFRIFDVASAGRLTLRSLTLRKGLADNGTEGGGAIFSRGALSVTSGKFTGNSAPATTGTSGGAINSSGPLTVTLSTFSGNSGQEGGGIFNQSLTATATVTKSTFTGNTGTIYGGGALVSADGTTIVAADTFAGNSTGPTGGGGAIDNDATVGISDSTFSGNTGGTNGGGAVQNFGTATITYSTLSGNSSPYGADIHNSTTKTLSVSSSIVAGGVGGSNCSGTPAITDGGYNIDSGTSCGFSAASHSMNSTNPQLGALASNGGPTQTMALPATSPAFGAIPRTVKGCTGSTDQRGIPRPQGTGCDVGAYERIVSGPVKGIASKCLDDYRSGTGNGNKIDLYTCNGKASQKWTAAVGNTLQARGKCLNDYHGGTANYTAIDLWSCNGTSAQVWVYQSDGAYLNPASHKCLDDYHARSTNGNKIDLYACNGKASQRWSTP
jgi:hypothetical protein